jgi:hypothetical protein
MLLFFQSSFIVTTIDAAKNTFDKSQIILYIYTFQMYKSKIIMTIQNNYNYSN